MKKRIETIAWLMPASVGAGAACDFFKAAEDQKIAAFGSSYVLILSV
jgi:hypothetical protein